MIVAHESLVGPEQLNCLLFFRKILQLTNIIWYESCETKPKMFKRLVCLGLGSKAVKIPRFNSRSRLKKMADCNLPVSSNPKKTEVVHFMDENP